MSVGDFVRFDIQGKIVFENRTVTIRDFSEIIVPQNGFLKLESGVFIGKNVEIGADYIQIGENSSIQNNCILLGNIDIGSNCLFGPSVYVSSGNHFFKYIPELLIRDQDMLICNESYRANKRIVIEDDVWIGKNVVIINNVTVGKGSIIGANTLINKNVEPYSIVAGSPYKIIGKRLDFYKDIPTVLHGNLIKCFPYFYSGFDYSIEGIKKNTYIRLIKPNFKIYVLNIHKQYFLTIEFLKSVDGTIIKYHNQESKVFEDKVSFKLLNKLDNFYTFLIELEKPNILVKKIYFENK